MREGIGRESSRYVDVIVIVLWAGAAEQNSRSELAGI